MFILNFGYSENLFIVIVIELQILRYLEIPLFAANWHYHIFKISCLTIMNQNYKFMKLWTREFFFISPKAPHGA